MLFKKTKIDSSDILGSIKALPEQCMQAWQEASKITLPENYINPKHLIISGMGGSGLGGRVLESVYRNNLRVPVMCIEDYHIPHYISFGSLMLATSYSGNTEETIASVNQAIEQKVPWVGIGTGGKLIEMAKSQGNPYYLINPTQNPSNQPRMAIGYSIIAQLVIAQKAGLIVFDQKQLDTIISSMKSVDEKKAKDMAKKLFNKQIIFVSSDFLDGATHVWNNQTNENAKVFSSHEVIPDINHHLMEGLQHPKCNKRDLAFVFIKSQLFSPELRKRFFITKDVVMQNGITAVDYEPLGPDALSETFEVIQFGAYVAYHLAMMYKTDPTPIPWVDYFKKKMLEK